MPLVLLLPGWLSPAMFKIRGNKTDSIKYFIISPSINVSPRRGGAEHGEPSVGDTSLLLWVSLFPHQTVRASSGGSPAQMTNAAACTQTCALLQH